MSFRVNGAKALVSFLCLLAFLIIGVVALFLRLFLMTSICLILFAVYGFLFFQNFSELKLDGNGVHKLFLGKELASWSWTSIQEIGVVSTRIFGGETARKNGTKYVYFSEKEMGEEDRFKMCLEWPPRKCGYALYTPKLLNCALEYSDVDAVYYNAEEP